MDYRLDDEFTFSNGLESSPKSDQKLNWYPHYRQVIYIDIFIYIGSNFNLIFRVYI